MNQFQRHTAYWAFFQGISAGLAFIFSSLIGLNERYFRQWMFEENPPQIMPSTFGREMIFIIGLLYIVLSYLISFYAVHRTTRLIIPAKHQELLSFIQMMVSAGYSFIWLVAVNVYVIERYQNTSDIERMLAICAYFLLAVCNIPFELMMVCATWFIFPSLPRLFNLLIAGLALGQVLSLLLSFFPEVGPSLALVILLQITWHILIAVFLWQDSPDKTELLNRT